MTYKALSEAPVSEKVEGLLKGDVVDPCLAKCAELPLKCLRFASWRIVIAKVGKPMRGKLTYEVFKVGSIVLIL